jgi:UDP-galactopyranose mutase
MCSCCCHHDRVKGRVDGKIVPIPPGQDTVNTLFDANVHSEEEMEVRRWQERCTNSSSTYLTSPAMQRRHGSPSDVW